MWQTSPSRVLCERVVVVGVSPLSLKTRVGGVLPVGVRLAFRAREWWWWALPSVTQNASGRGAGRLSRVSCKRVVVVGRVSPPSLKTRVGGVLPVGVRLAFRARVVVVVGSDVPAWLGLKARALAWLRRPVAWQIPSQGRGPRPWLGLAWLWLRPRLRAILYKK